jgi:hypothetical protein
VQEHNEQYTDRFGQEHTVKKVVRNVVISGSVNWRWNASWSCVSSRWVRWDDGSGFMLTPTLAG